MSRIEAFIPTVTLLDIITELAMAHKANIVFCRYKTTDQKPGFTIVSPASDIAEVYLNGGYEQILVSIKGLPKNEQDWEFTDRASANLIEISGARQQGQNLEQTVIRLVDKKSKAVKLFSAIKAAIKAKCGLGVTVNGNPYPKIYFAQDLLSMQMMLWVDMDSKLMSAKIVG